VDNPKGHILLAKFGANGRYLLAGISETNSGDGLLIKTDVQVRLQWSMNLGGPGLTWARDGATDQGLLISIYGLSR
jgi:hypothetical protein